MGATARDLESPMEQHQSSSAPTSTVDSSPLPSPNQAAHDTSSHSDQSFPSSCSSSSSSILADVIPQQRKGVETLSIQMEATPAQQHTQNLQKLKPHEQGPNKDKQLHPEASLKKEIGTKGECYNCAAGLTADCAAVCCFPLAVVHLLALTFIKLPSAMAWRALSNMKKRLCHKQIPTNGVGNEEKALQQSPQVSLAATATAAAAATAHVEHVVRLNSKSLRQHFEAGNVGFGGSSVKRDG